jgi:hypothetical protein
VQFLRALPDDSSYREYGRCIPADHSNYLPFRPASPTSFSFDRARAVLIAVRRSTVAAAVYFTMSFSSDMQSTTAFSTDGSPRRARASKAAARSSQPVVAHRIRQRLGCCWIWIMCQLPSGRRTNRRGIILRDLLSFGSLASRCSSSTSYPPALPAPADLTSGSSSFSAFSATLTLYSHLRQTQNADRRDPVARLVSGTWLPSICQASFF